MGLVKTKQKPRRVALRSHERPRPEPRKPSEHVVVEIFGDGWIQVYAADNVHVHIFNRLRINNPTMADDVDEFHLLDMPRPYREIYFPRNIRATGLLEKRTIKGEYLRREKLKVLREYQNLAEDLKKKGVAK